MQAVDPLGQPWMFTARCFDGETGLYHYRARAYDPARGRFLQRDPLGFAVSPNLQAYVRSRPSGLIDPLGLVDSVAAIAAVNRGLSREDQRWLAVNLTSHGAMGQDVSALENLKNNDPFTLTRPNVTVFTAREGLVVSGRPSWVPDGKPTISARDKTYRKYCTNDCRTNVLTFGRTCNVVTIRATWRVTTQAEKEVYSVTVSRGIIPDRPSEEAITMGEDLQDHATLVSGPKAALTRSPAAGALAVGEGLLGYYVENNPWHDAGWRGLVTPHTSPTGETRVKETWSNFYGIRTIKRNVRCPVYGAGVGECDGAGFPKDMPRSPMPTECGDGPAPPDWE